MGYHVDMLSTAIFAAVMTLLWVVQGKIKLTPENWEKKLSLLRSRRLPAGLSGIVLNCPQDSELWRNVIDYLAPLVDAAIISAPERTAQLDWEVTRLQPVLGFPKMCLLKSAATATHSIPDGINVIDVPARGSWWRNYRVSYFGTAWKTATAAILRAIEHERASAHNA